MIWAQFTETGHWHRAKQAGETTWKTDCFKTFLMQPLRTEPLSSEIIGRICQHCLRKERNDR